ncbi:Calmodulin-binding transcription activator 1 [Bagarius yarrelli]|uniref:Calmodulin-binding transcription activator 1 n=1 Tax=Bagarius yarrelli TaxID=175774 RepID=A0A556V1A8_BAGYA|nr:Calmodulin-binding transcription activator 1 [Bagarius yarrelli]
MQMVASAGEACAKKTLPPPLDFPSNTRPCQTAGLNTRENLLNISSLFDHLQHLSPSQAYGSPCTDVRRAWLSERAHSQQQVEMTSSALQQTAALGLNKDMSKLLLRAALLIAEMVSNCDNDTVVLQVIIVSQHPYNQFRMSILERLEQMERRMAEMAGQQQQSNGATGGAGAGEGGGGTGGGGNGGNSSSSQSQCLSGQGQAGSSFESRVVVVCEKMMNRACWAKSKHLIHSKTFRGMTLLHLAAGQGYATLIKTLIKWRTKHADSIDLELEVDPLNVDHFSCTPLMWACALGHLEAALVLYKWDRRALTIPDSLGRLPLSIARSRGHTKLAECLEQLQREEQQPPSTHMTFSSNSDARSSDSWIDSWTNNGIVTPSSHKSGASITATTNPSSNLTPDLRRPRSEPSSYYSNECQQDLPAAKKHKPNPEAVQMRLNKAVSAPLSLELHKLSTSSNTLSAETPGGEQNPAAKGTKTSGILQAKLSSFRTGGQKWSSRDVYRKVSGGGGGSSIGKEKLATRLRQRGENLSMMTMADREMVETELLTYKEDLENQDCLSHMEDLQANMMTLAEHIIEATPERIKKESFSAVESVPLDSSGLSSTMSWLATYLGDSDGPYEKGALPSPANWTEFLNASNSKMERDLSQLTLTDLEQRELYEAARLVQSAFRKYKLVVQCLSQPAGTGPCAALISCSAPLQERPLREQQEVAAAVIQRCYRKYKQYALYKKMTQAAILIQSKFRSYHVQKKFQQSRRAAVLIQQYYRSYREIRQLRPHRRTATSALVQHKLRSSLLTKRQEQAALKIMRYLRRCRHSPLMDHRLFKRGAKSGEGEVEQVTGESAAAYWELSQSRVLINLL